MTTDFASISTSALIEIALVLRAQTDGSSLDSIPTTVPTSSPSSLDVWVNGLWFVSLTLSLGAALLAVLVKQWLRQYMSRISGTVRDRSHIRQYRFEGIQRWHVLTFVAVMPIILHVAVGLFLAGLVLFLVPLRPVIAGLVGAITMIIYATYIITNVLPLFRVQCPYRTPFSDVLHAIRHGIRSLFKPQGFIITLRDAERLAVTSINITEDACLGALEWLLSITTNPPTQNIVLQSLGAFSPAMTERLQRSPTNFVIPGELVDECLTSDGKLSFAVIPGSEARIERILRSCLHLPSSRRSAYRLISGVTDPALQAVMILNNLPVARMGYQLWTSSLPFLEHTILVHPEGVSVLPRLIWDALVRAAIHDIVSLRDDLPLFNPEFRLKLCKIVYQTFNTPLPLTMESENLLPIGYALDDLLPHILWPHMDVSYPTAHRLEVMLTVSDYLSSIDNPLDTSLRMVSATWQALENLDLDNVEHRRLLRRKTKELLLGSSFLNPHKWKGVPRRERQHLPRCWLAILRVYHKVGVFDTELPYQSITSRTTLRSVVELARSISPDMSTEIVDKLWIFALECDHPQGFEAVLEDDILGSLPLPDAWTTTAKRVATFISGLVRLLDVDLWAPYVEYVMEPEHLFHACLMLAAAPNADQLRDLIQLSPENSSWAYARQRLRAYLDEHPSERYAAQEALPRPIQLSTLPVPMDDRLQFLRGLERVYRGIEDHFRAVRSIVVARSHSLTFLLGTSSGA